MKERTELRVHVYVEDALCVRMYNENRHFGIAFLFGL